MEFVPSFKLTDIPKVDAAGLDKQLLADRTATAFLSQILKTVTPVTPVTSATPVSSLRSLRQ